MIQPPHRSVNSVLSISTSDYLQKSKRSTCSENCRTIPQHGHKPSKLRSTATNHAELSNFVHVQCIGNHCCRYPLSKPQLPYQLHEPNTQNLPMPMSYKTGLNCFHSAKENSYPTQSHCSDFNGCASSHPHTHTPYLHLRSPASWILAVSATWFRVAGAHDDAAAVRAC